MSEGKILDRPKAVQETVTAGVGVCKPSDRADNGLRRYRIRGETPGGNQPVRYVKARSEEEAKAVYAKTVPADQLKAVGRDANGKLFETALPLHLVVTALAD